MTCEGRGIGQRLSPEGWVRAGGGGTSDGEDDEGKSGEGGATTWRGGRTGEEWGRGGGEIGEVEGRGETVRIGLGREEQEREQGRAGGRCWVRGRHELR